MSQMIKVGMADLNICKSPDAITTLGLGSCIGIAIYDPVTKIGGLAHIIFAGQYEDPEQFQYCQICGYWHCGTCEPDGAGGCEQNAYGS